MKKIISILLSCFVIVSVIWLIITETRRIPEKKKVPIETSTQTKKNTAIPGKSANKKMTSSIIVYYLFTNYRCATCKLFEKYTNDSVEENFEKEIASKRLKFLMVNIEKPENEHYFADFKLEIPKAVVVVEIENGVTERYKKLGKIWDIHGDEKVFKKYIRDEVSSYLKE